MNCRGLARAGLLAVVGSGSLAHTTAAQSLAIGAGVGQYRVRSNTAAIRQVFSGIGLAVQGTATLGRFKTRVAYGEATLDLDGGGAPGSVLVEGEVMAGLAVQPWVTLWAGPHVRAHETDQQTARWVLWEGRVDLSGMLIARRLAWSLETWGVASATTDVPEPFDQGLGARGSVAMRLSGRSLWGHLAYRVEQARMGQGVRRETTEVLSIWLTLGER